MSIQWKDADAAVTPSRRIEAIDLQYKARRLQSQAMAATLRGLFHYFRRLVRGVVAPSPTHMATN